jgi:hypothetical protein
MSAGWVVLLVKLAMYFALAFTFALLCFGIADNAKTPELVRIIISPGVKIADWLVSLSPRPALSFRGSIDEFGREMALSLLVNTIYYALLIYTVVAIAGPRLRNKRQ